MGTLHDILVAGLVAAEGGGHEAGGLLQQLGIEPKLIVAQIVGFLLLFLVLRRFLYRPVLTMLDQREEEITTRYRDAEDAQAEADRARREYEARMGQAETEARDRIHEGIREGQRMRTEIVQQAQQERDRIVQQGNREVSEEREKMMYSVRETVIDMAVDAAGRVISRSMDDATHRALVQEFLAQVPAGQEGEARA